jgi:hypothetical protein
MRIAKSKVLVEEEHTCSEIEGEWRLGLVFAELVLSWDARHEHQDIVLDGEAVRELESWNVR